MSITPAVSRRSRKPLPRQISVTGVTVIAGLGSTAVVAGSPLVFVGLGGFVLWLVWLTATELRLLLRAV